MSQNRINELENLIISHKKKYYTGQAEISDDAFDALEEELRKRHPESKVLQMVGYEVNEDKIKHDHPMLSLSKSKDVRDLLEWMKNEPCIVTDKLDGSSASIIYQDGYFILAKSRGDGVFGENLTKYFRYIQIPKRIDDVIFKGKQIEIRGEVCVSKKNFEHIANEMETRKLDRPKSIRNIVAGLLHKKGDLDLCHFLDFIGYEILAKDLDLQTEEEKLKILQRQGIQIPFFTVVNSSAEIEAAIADYAKRIEAHPYLTDGLVIAINDLDIQRVRGATAHHPKGKMAFKFQSETAITTVKDILIDVGRTGKVSFVGLVEPTELSGATVQRVTFHNLKYISTHNINIGSTIRITRSGEVIPKHVETVISTGTFTIPTHCPVCDTTLGKSETGVDLICLNPNCSAKTYGRILLWIKTVGIDNLGEETLKKLFDKKIVATVPEIYQLTPEKIVALEKHGERSAQKIIENIRSTRKISLENFIVALGIDGLGKGVARLILDVYPTWQQITELSLDALLEIKGIGDVLAENIQIGIKEYGITLFDALNNVGVSIEDEERGQANEIKGFTGMTFVITGTLSKPRKEIETYIEQNGGLVTGSVSKKTRYLVCNEKMDSSKYKKAIKLDVPIITEAQLYQLI